MTLPVQIRADGKGSETKDRPDWASVFDQFEVKGTLVVVDERGGEPQTSVFNLDRADRRLTPASTFKIPHALMALDAGVIDEFQVVPWDGKKRSYPDWNKNQDLRSSMRHSVVWVYQMFAEKIGLEKERVYLEKIGYGNCDVSGDEPFWIEGNLGISAIEQVGFLRKLYRNQLPFSVANQRLVKDIMLVEAGRDWRLRAKTGWSGTVGWWVGWVERPEGTVFFALNIDTPNRNEDLPKREAIVRVVLSEMGVLQASPKDR